MPSKTIHASAIKLNYLIENDIQEKIIFFIHGNSISSRSWKKQLHSQALSSYKLIAFDLPAHGDSEASENAERDYSLPGLAAILAEAIKELAGNKPYLLAGLSLGTNIVAETLACGLKPSGILLAGACIIGENHTPESFVKKNNNAHVVFLEKAPLNEVKIYASEGMFSNEGNDREEAIEDYYRVQPPFRSTLTNSIQLRNYSNEIDLIRQFKKPVLLIFGNEERVVNPDYLDNVDLNLWDDTVYKIPGAGHLVNIDQPEEFNRLLADYADDSFK